MRAVPWQTLSLALVVLALLLVDAGLSLLSLDRSAVLDGEIWRLLTGHWVHWSTAHGVLNLLAFVSAGVLIEGRWGCSPVLPVAVLGVGVSFAILAFCPAVEVYAGLSGVTIGLLIWAALLGWRLEPERRQIWGLLFLGVTVKVGLEVLGYGAPTVPGGSSVANLPWAHLAGWVGALGLLLMERARGMI